MNAALTDKLITYLLRLWKSEIPVQRSQFLCSFPCPAMFSSLAQMLRECQRPSLAASPLDYCRALKRNGKQHGAENIAGQLHLKAMQVDDKAIYLSLSLFFF